MSCRITPPQCNDNIFSSGVHVDTEHQLFTEPLFYMTGTTKIVSGLTETSEGVFNLSDLTGVTYEFIFTGNTDQFTSTTTSFVYDVHRFDSDTSEFETGATLTRTFPYSTFSGTNTIEDTIVVSGLSGDNEYLIKGYYLLTGTTLLTDYLKTEFTTKRLSGSEFGLYDSGLDWYFVALSDPDIPSFDFTVEPLSDTTLFVEQLNVSFNGQTSLTLTNEPNGFVSVNVNGNTLLIGVDYTIDGTTLDFNEDLLVTDVVMVYFVPAGTSNVFATEAFVVTGITSGTTAGPTDKVFFNTGTSKSEIFLDEEPVSGNDIVLKVNGSTLLLGSDYTQSVSDPTKLIILSDVIIVGDTIEIYYAVTATAQITLLNVTGLTPSWIVANAPANDDGLFTLQVTTVPDSGFTSVLYSATTPYVVDQTTYSATAGPITGDTGDQFTYRVKNDKFYTTISGDTLTTTSISEVVTFELGQPLFI